MKNEIELYELIERYLGGTLTAEEKFAFEIRLSSDPEFEQTVEKHRQLSELIEEGTLLEIRDSIRKIHHGSNGGAKSFFSGKRLIFLSVIIISGIIITALLLHNSERQDQGLPGRIVPALDSPHADQYSEKDYEEENTKAEARAVGSKTESKVKYQSEKPEKAVCRKDQVFKDDQSKENETEIENKHLPEIPGMIADSNQPENTIIPMPIAKSVLAVNTDSVNCDTVSISADIYTEASCEERSTGKIRVSNISARGALVPFSVSVDDAENFQMKYEIVDLPPGIYPVWMKDRNNCLSKIGNFLVGSITCDYEYIFAPAKGEQWDIPSNEKSGVLKIHSKQGILVYSLLLEEGNRYQWDGNSTDGAPQPMGVYRFIIEFNEGDPLHGNVTIVR
jgi:hypothetical protein